MIAVLEVVKGADGIWETVDVDVRTSDDLDTIDRLDRYPSERAQVRVRGALKTLTVYRTDEDGGLVTYEEAYAP